MRNRLKYGSYIRIDDKIHKVINTYYKKGKLIELHTESGLNLSDLKRISKTKKIYGML